MYTKELFIAIPISDEGSSFLYIKTKNFSLVLEKRILLFSHLGSHRGQKYGILPLLTQ